VGDDTKERKQEEMEKLTEESKRRSGSNARREEVGQESTER